MSELRGPYSPKVSSKIVKEPSFYQQDLDKYKDKVKKEKENNKDNPLYSPINIAHRENVFGSGSNPSKINFSVTLRKDSTENSAWRCLNYSPKKELLNKVLPPINSSSKELFSKMNSIRQYDMVLEV